MGLKSGLAGQLMIAEESVWGTGVTPTLGVPLVNETLTQQIDRLESKGMQAGQRVIKSQQWSPGNQYVKGMIGIEVDDRTSSLIWKHMFGAVATSGAGPYTHTYTPGDLTGKGLTIQIGRPNTTDGTVHPFTFVGCKFGKWTLGLKANEIATLGLDVIAKSETTATALAAASYAASITPLTFVGASLTLSGVAYKFNALTLSGDNKLDDKRIFAGQTNVDEPLEIDWRVYTGTIDSEFNDLTAYNRFVNGTEGAMVLHMVKGASSIDVTMNVRYDGQSPNVAGPQIIRQPLPFKAIASTTDASAITSVNVNADVTP